MRVTFQNMFPSINVKTVKLSDCRRVVLFHFLKEEGVVEVRHYAIRANPVGINRNVKRILQAKIPDLSQLEVSYLYSYSFSCIFYRRIFDTGYE